MGLDMYAYFVDKDDVVDDFKYKEHKKCYREEDFYWRKNRHLHNWMTSLWLKKKDDPELGREDFNCRPVRLKKKDLNKLKEDIKAGNLSGASGFFFGDNEYDEYYKERDLQFIKEALQAIDDGYAVYYNSWW